MEEQADLHTLQEEVASLQQALQQVTREKAQLAAMTRHLNFLDNALDGFLFTNERGEVLFANLPLLRMFGYADVDRPALIGTPLPTLHWQNSGDPQRLYEEVRREGFVRDFRADFNALDGRTFSAAVSAVETRDSQGAVVGTQYTLRALLPRVGRGTAELRAENRELAALTTIGRSVLSTMSIDEVVHHLLQTVRDFFDITKVWVYLKQTDGRAPQLVAHAGLDDAELSRVATAGAELFELRLLSAEGRPRLISTGKSRTGTLVARGLGIANLAMAPLLAYDLAQGTPREPIGLLVIGSTARTAFVEEDLASLERIAQYAGLALSNAVLYSNLQAAYEELKRAQEQLVEAERQKVAVQMAGAAAHELNQPLTVLLGYSNMLGRMMQPDDPQRPIYEKIERATRKISEVVERLGQLTRYRTRSYIEGQPIVDLEAGSRPEGEELAEEIRD